MIRMSTHRRPLLSLSHLHPLALLPPIAAPPLAFVVVLLIEEAGAVDDKLLAARRVRRGRCALLIFVLFCVDLEEFGKEVEGAHVAELAGDLAEPAVPVRDRSVGDPNSTSPER